MEVKFGGKEFGRAGETARASGSLGTASACVTPGALPQTWEPRNRPAGDEEGVECRECEPGDGVPRQEAGG